MGRDLKILKEVYRFHFCLGRHIMFLASFSGARACNRRLKILVDNGFLLRKKILYGIPYLYYLSKSGMRMINVSPRDEKIRIDRIHHDVTVLDCLPSLLSRYELSLENATTERELHINDGFGVRKHHPDIVFYKDDESYAFEIELTLKEKSRLENNIKQNYLNFDRQLWVIPVTQVKLLNILKESCTKYDNIEVITLESLL